MRPLATPLLALGSLVAFASPVLAATDLGTKAEQTSFVETGRYDETIRLCEAFARAYPRTVRCFDFGTTPEGRPMKALAISRSGALDAQAAKAKRIPVVLVQGGIHAGEIDGKDAGFWLLRRMLEGGDPNVASLDKLVWLFVPVFNVDGHERFGAWNRPNQRGPKEMGWRTTAQDLNLNRDYVKAEAPEMQAMLKLVNAWDPLMEVDLHVTDGAKFEQGGSFTGEPVVAGDAELAKVGRKLRADVIDAMNDNGARMLPFYPSFVGYDDPASGFEDVVFTPRFSDGYFTMLNRYGWMLETHSWKDYKTRVQYTYDCIASILRQVAKNGVKWQQLEREADARASQLGGTPVDLAWQATDKAHVIKFKGYAYARTPSDVSGALMTAYDESKPQTWKVPLRDDLQPSLTIVAPKGGYIVPAAWAEIVAKNLDLHGIAYSRLGAKANVDAQRFRADDFSFSPQSFEGHQQLTKISGEWKASTSNVDAGALFVPIAQPKARLVMSILEPQAPDSLLQWGTFNNAFERKEYMEAYVAEQVARDMLAKDPALKAEFEQKLKDDPKFAADPRARLDFFARRNSDWDTAYALYPVLRTDDVLN